MLFANHITSRRKEGLATAENWMDVGAGESEQWRGVGVRVGGWGFGGWGLEVGSTYYNTGQTRTQPKSGMEIKNK